MRPTAKTIWARPNFLTLTMVMSAPIVPRALAPGVAGHFLSFRRELFEFSLLIGREWPKIKTTFFF
jgi:hypothetical protein